MVIPYVIYPFDLIVIRGGTFLDAEKHLKTLLPEESYPEIKRLNVDSIARTVMFSTGQTCIRFGNNPGPGVIAHEVFHAVEFLFDKIGMKLTHKSDEAYAYLIQYVVEEIYEK